MLNPATGHSLRRPDLFDSLASEGVSSDALDALELAASSELIEWRESLSETGTKLFTVSFGGQEVAGELYGSAFLSELSRMIEAIKLGLCRLWCEEWAAKRKLAEDVPE